MKTQAILFDFASSLLDLYEEARKEKITTDEYEDKLVMLVKNYDLKIKEKIRKGEI